MTKKKIAFLAVTNSADTKDRTYSDYVLEQCKNALLISSEASSAFDIEEFKRHDMISQSSLEKNMIKLIREADYYVILIDCFDGTYCPNVWFELGILAITSQKPMILIAQKGKHDQFPFYIRNQVNVLLFPQIEIDLRDNQYTVNFSELHYKQMDQFKKAFIERFVSGTASPFGMFSDAVYLKLSGYEDLRQFETKLMKIVANTEMAKYIDGEENAFKALKEAVSTAQFSLRTTRFANQSIIHSGINENPHDSVISAHDAFMKAVYDASKRIAQNRDDNKYPEVVYRCDRIICNNSSYKWKDIYSALYKSSDIMKVYVRKLAYSINFELVIVDEKIAFIHFYQTNHSGHNSSDIQRIKSTLKISDPGVCVELSKVFDRLHHRDFDSKCCDLSRTLLGVEKDKYVSGKSPEFGYFTINNCCEDDRDKNIKKQFIDALKNWEFPNDNEDKIIMAIGYIKVAEIFDIDKFFREMDFSEDEKETIRKKLEAQGDD